MPDAAGKLTPEDLQKIHAWLAKFSPRTLRHVSQRFAVGMQPLPTGHCRNFGP